MENTLQKIKNYIKKTDIQNLYRYDLALYEVKAICAALGGNEDVVYTAFRFGMAKGFRAANALK